jgi:glycosyltransferase involved in cell wall biosynthesis
MTRILFVPLGPPEVACSRVRIYQYLPELESMGVETKVIPFFPGPPAEPCVERGAGAGLAARLRTLRRSLQIAVLAPRYDLVVLQRVLLPISLQRLLARRARALAFDVDDAIYTSDDPARRADAWTRREARRFRSMARLSSAVLVSTPYLAEVARPDAARTFVIPSTVDCARYRPAERASRPFVTVGWIGSPSTTPYLAPLRPIFRRLAARGPVRFELVGADRRFQAEPAEIQPWSLEGELDRLAGFDIGLMPLPDDEWTRAKAGYKLLQYMALGIASVASPVGINRELVRNGETGLLAEDPPAWEAALARLIEDAALRRRLGRAGRDLVEREYSVRVWAPRLARTLAAVAKGAPVA